MTDKSRAFGIIAQAVIQDDHLSIGARMLYALLASYADATSRECRPLNSTLCEKMRCKPSKLAEWLKELRAAGVIERIDRKAEQRSSITRLTDLLAWPASSTHVDLVHDGGSPSSTHVDVPHPHTWTQNNNSKNSTSRTPKSRASAAPARWLVGDEQSGTDSLSLAAWAEQEFGIKNVDWLQRQVDGFLDWARSTDKKYVDWKAAIRNAVRREAERSTQTRQAPTAVADEFSEDEIRIFLKEHGPYSNDPTWQEYRKAELECSPDLPRLEEKFNRERREFAIASLRALR